MIVLDEQIHQADIVTAIAAWYPGRVVSIKALRPQTIIKDDAIETLLQRADAPTFVTINIKDFWRVTVASPRYCVVCIALPLVEIANLPEWLRRCLRLPDFKTKAARMGKVISLRPTRIDYYEPDGVMNTIGWNE